MPRITAEAGPGDGPSLIDWPLLAWTPEEGVCTEDRHVSVALIAKAAEVEPQADHRALGAILGTSPEHVRQALNYHAARALAL